jgi:hypothetical protein
MRAEARLRELGFDLPDYNERPFAGMAYGTMKPYHILGKVLYLSGHVPERDGEVLYPGRLGEDLTIEEGYRAAQIACVNVLAGIKQALGDLDRIKGLIRSLNFVVCTPDFHDVHKVSSGVTDLFHQVYGDAKGIGCRATIGMQALTRRHCFETWVEVEIE